MTPNFEIFTNRLHLRILTTNDSIEFSQQISASKSLYPWLDWCHAHFDNQEANEFIVANRLNWIKNTAYGFGVFDRQNDAFVGMVAINEIHLTSNMASIGYWVADNHQGLGYATEALKAIIEMSFAQLAFTRLEIICDPKNLLSHKVAQKCGAIEEGVARNRFLFSGKPKDGLVFSVIPD